MGKFKQKGLFMSKRVAQVKPRDSIGLKEQAPGDLLVPHHWYIAMTEN